MLLSVLLVASTPDTQSESQPEPIIIIEEVARDIPLTIAPADWKYRGFVEGYAHLYLTALQHGSKSDFLKLHLESENTAHARDAVRLAFGRHAGFKALRKMRFTPEMSIFTYGSAAELQDQRVDDGMGNIAASYGCTICFCIERDCTARWPKTLWQTYNREDRPYVCTDFGPFKIYKDGYAPAFWTWPPQVQPDAAAD